MVGETNTDRQTLDINGHVKVAVILSKMIFSSSKLLHALAQYICNESAN